MKRDLVLEHGDFLRSIVRDLVDDESVDDVVQETWLAALRHPPRRRGKTRAWLATVARNAARRRHRSRIRRERREQMSARTGSNEPDSGARAETARLIAEAVLALDEPERTAVVHRYWDQLGVGEIARRLGVPRDTVKTRLRRALARLRRRLDAEHGDDRSAWVSVLAPMIGLSTPSTTSITSGGGGIMTAKGKTGLAAGIAALLVIATISIGSLVGDDDPAPLDGAVTTGAERTPDRSLQRERGDATTSDTTGRVSDGATPEPPPGPRRILVRGTVVDASRRPVEGATVALRTADPTGPATRTGDGGRFTLGLSPVSLGARHAPRGRASLVVHHPAAGVRSLALRRDGDAADVRDLGRIVLGPAHDLTVRLERFGAPVAGARLRLLAGTLSEGRFAGEGTSDADGRVTLRTLPGGDYVARAEAPSGEIAVVALTVPVRTGGVLPIELSEGRTVAIHVQDQDGRPLSGALVTVRIPADDLGGPMTVPPTDARGMTSCRVPADGELHVAARAEGYRSARPVAVAAGETEVTVEFAEYPPAVWPIASDSTVIPPDGTTIRIVPSMRKSGRPGEELRGRIENGQLVVDTPVHRLFRARALDEEGHVALLGLSLRTPEQKPIRFVAPRRLSVRVQDPRGEPRAGLRVLATHGYGGELVPRAGTDAEGRCVFTDLPAARIHVLVALSDKVPVEKSPVAELVGRATVDLASGDGEVTVVVAGPRRVTLDFAGRGVPRLPRDWRVGSAQGVVRVESEDPDAGLAVLHLHPTAAHLDQAMTLRVRARGEGAWKFEVPADASSELRLPCPLPEMEALTLRVLPPEDGLYQVSIDGLEDGATAWTRLADVRSQTHRLDQDRNEHRHELRVRAATRLRLHDHASGVIQELVKPTGGAFLATLDLRTVRSLEVAVEVPDGHRSRDVVLIRWFDEEGRRRALASPHRSSVARNDGGTFRLRCAFDRPFTLRAWHPELTARTDRNEITLRDPPATLRLSLIPDEDQ